MIGFPVRGKSWILQVVVLAVLQPPSGRCWLRAFD